MLIPSNTTHATGRKDYRLFEKETERGVGAMRSKDGKAARDYEM